MREQAEEEEDDHDDYDYNDAGDFYEAHAGGSDPNVRWRVCVYVCVCLARACAWTTYGVWWWCVRARADGLCVYGNRGRTTVTLVRRARTGASALLRGLSVFLRKCM